MIRNQEDLPNEEALVQAIHLNYKNPWDKHLRKDLHATAYWLYPAFQYDEKNFCRKLAVNMAVLDYIGKKI